MKKVAAFVYLFALLLMILTPAVLGVNSGTGGRAIFRVDGGPPPPPCPPNLPPHMSISTISTS